MLQGVLIPPSGLSRLSFARLPGIRALRIRFDLRRLEVLCFVIAGTMLVVVSAQSA